MLVLSLSLRILKRCTPQLSALAPTAMRSVSKRLRQQWSQHIRQTRAQWSGPSEHSVLCSKHFTERCFESSSVLALKVGLYKGRSLKSDYFPTIFERPAPSLPADMSSDRSLRQKRAATSASSTEDNDATQQAKRTIAYKNNPGNICDGAWENRPLC